MKKTKLMALLLALVMVFSLTTPALAAVPAQDIVVLYTNDVHAGVDTSLGYAGLAAYKSEMETQYGADHVTLVDAGDAVQGEAIATLSKGSYLVDIMNKVGYDVVTLGNHEFDYGMARALELMAMQKAAVVSCNFKSLTTGKAVFNPYKIITYGDTKIAYVGITTPETFTKSTPTYFQDAKGNYIYGFCEGNSGADLYSAVQSAVNAAKAEGADYVIAVGHLGVDQQSAPWRSADVIANTTGIDAFIDGHSHSVIAGEKVKSKDGKEVVLTSTGTKLTAIGKLVLSKDGTITTQLVTDYTAKDAEVDTYIKDIQALFAADLKKVVAKTTVALNGERAPGVRTQETNLGDLCADAYRALLGTDIAFVNGGGIRVSLPAGDITYGDIINIHPFGNMACSVEATGQQILDALEMASRLAPTANGGFLQVSGLTYTIDATVKSSVVTDEKGNFVSVNGAYRVTGVKVGGAALDLTKTYTLASHNYMLKSGGDGLNMFMKDKVLQNEVLIDNQVLINYIVDNLGGVIGDQYKEAQGRITVIKNPFADVTFDDWYYNAVITSYKNGLVVGVGDGQYGSDAQFTVGSYLTVLYRLYEESFAAKETTGANWDEAAKYLNETFSFGFKDLSAAVTREEMAYVAAVVLDYVCKAEGTTASFVNTPVTFTDIGEVNSAYAEYVTWFQKVGGINGIPNGDGTYRYDPTGITTRSQAAQVIYNLSQVVKLSKAAA